MKAIIVGSGFAGSVIARFLAEKANMEVTIYEKRDHIAGNAFDMKNEHGIIIQKYGPHIFHTNAKKIYDYISQFSQWEIYNLKCMVYMEGKYTPSPFNFQTIDDYYSVEKATEIKNRLKDLYPNQSKITIVELMESTDEIVKNYAMFLFEKDYKLYTAKQWGISPDEIDVSVLKRVPVLLTYQNGYFDDKYQIMPKFGFTPVFHEILDHPNIEVKLNTNIKNYLHIDTKSKKIFFNNEVCDDLIIYTGPLDELLDFKYGQLNYRSLRFEYITEYKESYQDAAVVAYPQADGFTRITEFTKLPVQKVGNVTTIAKEYPLQFNKEDDIEPYYPIPTEKNIEQYNMYQNELKDIENLYMCGRLADYKYYNMDQIIMRAFETCNLIQKGIGRY